LTKRNYEELIALYDKYSDQGLEILAFPCNKFGAQEPGEDEEIASWAKGKGAHFPVLGKLDCVGGDTSHKLFQFLTKFIGGGLLGDGLKWNFHKFLVNADGIPVKRYGPIDYPKGFEADIKELLAIPSGTATSTEAAEKDADEKSL